MTHDLTARIDALIAPLPGKVGRRYELDFPAEGQFGVIWEDIAVEDLTPEMHHFDGLDFKILAERDEALKGDPSWEFMAQALPLLIEARAQIAAQAEALAAAEWGGTQQGAPYGSMWHNTPGPLIPACPICNGVHPEKGKREFNAEALGHRPTCPFALLGAQS